MQRSSSSPRSDTVETERLRLRRHRLDDFPRSFALWTEPVVTRYITGKPSSEQQAWSRVLGYAGHWALLGFGYWAVEERLSGEFVGEVGLADFKRDIDPSIRGIPEIGWVLSPPAHGRGYATEAVRAALAWADERLESESTVCLVDAENAPSLRVAEKAGYRRVRQIAYNGAPTILFSRARHSRSV